MFGLEHCVSRTHHVLVLEADVGAGVDAQRGGQAEQPRQRLDAQAVEDRLALLELHIREYHARPGILGQLVRCLRPARTQGLGLRVGHGTVASPPETMWD